MLKYLNNVKEVYKMDLRNQKTIKNIRNAFIELRSKKPLEKITVKELSELAQVNKATFYRHYEDIYALSDELENEMIKSCIDILPSADSLFQESGIKEMANAFSSQSKLFNILFSGSRKDVAIHKMHNYMMDKIIGHQPEYQKNLEKKIMLTTLIHGMFQAYFTYANEDMDIFISSVCKLNKAIHE